MSSEKHGNSRKCPGCGAFVESFQTKCSECGHEFNNVASAQSASKLFDLLQAADMRKSQELAAHNVEKNRRLEELAKMHNSDSSFAKVFSGGKRHAREDEEREDLIRELNAQAKEIERKFSVEKAQIIKTYPIPNSKEDLLEMLAMASSSAYDNDGVIGKEEEVWIQKTDQIYQKIIICASNDKTILEQATGMVASLIKRLPKGYKNFTQIPREYRAKLNEEIKQEKQDLKEEKKKILIGILTGWRGILAAVFLLTAIICIIIGGGAIVIGVLALIGVIISLNLISKQYKKETSQEGLF